MINEATAARIGELLTSSPRLLSTSIYEILHAEGFAGSYPSVVRHVRERRGPRFRVAPAVSVPIETAPGEETQFDWSDCSDWTVRWGLGEVQCFGCILCWSRYKRWWFSTSIDREHTFEGLVSFFEEVGGVTRVGGSNMVWIIATAAAGLPSDGTPSEHPRRRFAQVPGSGRDQVRERSPQSLQGGTGPVLVHIAYRIWYQAYRDLRTSVEFKPPG